MKLDGVVLGVSGSKMQCIANELHDETRNVGLGQIDAYLGVACSGLVLFGIENQEFKVFIGGPFFVNLLRMVKCLFKPNL